MRLWLILAAIGIALVSCVQPSQGAHIVVQNEPVAVERTEIELPPAVVATRDVLEGIARVGSPWDMAKLARMTPGFRSNAGGLDHADYWYLKYRTGDWPMEHVAKVLAYPPGVEETEGGLVYVWPYMALKRASEITPKVHRDNEELLGAEAAQRVAIGADWPGYRLGIAEDGTWLYFYTGAE